MALGGMTGIGPGTLSPVSAATGFLGKALAVKALLFGLIFGASNKIGDSIAKEIPSVRYTILLIVAILFSALMFFNSFTILGRIALYAVYVTAYMVLFKRYSNGASPLIRKGLFFIVVGVLGIDFGNWIAGLELTGAFKYLAAFGIFLVTLFGYLGPVIFLMSTNHDENIVATLLEIALFLVLIIFLISQLQDLGVFGNRTSEISSEQKSVLAAIWTSIKDTSVSFWEIAVGTYNSTRSGFNESIARIQGKSYEEEVDENAGVEALGITLEDFEFSNSDREYFQGDPVSVWTSMTAKSLDRNMNVKIDCFADRKKGASYKIMGGVSNSEFIIEDTGYKDVVCKFPRDTFDKVDDHEVEIIATFDFTTNSYLRRYFISEVDYLALRQNDVDVEDFYQISSEDEYGKYTNGPVELTVLKNNLVQPVNGDVSFVLGIEVDVNKRAGFDNGRILEFDNLVISLPSGFTLARQSGQYDCGQYLLVDYSENDCIADCGALDKDSRCVQDCSEYNMYRLDLTEENEGKNGVVTKEDSYGVNYVKTPFTIPCFVETSELKALDGKIGIKNFRASADYTFEISTKKTFEVNEKEGYVNEKNRYEFDGYVTYFYNVKPTTKTDLEMQSIYLNAKPYIKEAEPYLGTARINDLLRALIAYNYRNGEYNTRGIGLTGISKNNLIEIGVPTTNVTEDHKEIDYTLQYLKLKMEDEKCTAYSEKYLDCALSYFLCGTSEGSCSETLLPQVYNLTKIYAK